MQRHVEHAGCGGRSGPRTITAARLTGGALVGGPSRGGYGRVEVEGFRGSIRRPAPLVGVSILSIGGWADGRGSGVGTGTWLYAGYASPEVFGAVGAGVDWLIYDHVNGEGAVGVLSPFGVANVGLSYPGARIFVDGRVQRRFHFGMPAETQKGLGVGFTLVL